MDYSFITEISKHIKTKKSVDGSSAMWNFDLYFPIFVVALRDFSLDLQKDGKEITSDEYLENCLALKTETDDISVKFNEPRRCMRRFFKERKCFTFDRPAGRKVLKNLEHASDGDLSEDFVAELTAFCTFVHDQCGQKKLDTGMPVTGRMLVTLVVTYVQAIRDGDLPCIENALTAMTILENTTATVEAVKLYMSRMTDVVEMPTDNDAILYEAHHGCWKEALKHFLKKAIYDEGNKFQERMNENVTIEFEALKLENAKVSEQKCREVLQQLNFTISAKLESGAYITRDGYSLYQEDLRQLQTEYQLKQGLGVKAKDTMSSFLQEIWPEGKTILSADKKISEDEMRIEVQRQKAVQAERDRQAVERESQLIADHAKHTEQTLTENIEQLEKKRKEELINMQKTYDLSMSARVAEQKKTMEEGFKKEADAMRAQIGLVDKLKQDITEKYAREAQETRDVMTKMVKDNSEREAVRKRETEEKLAMMAKENKRTQDALRAEKQAIDDIYRQSLRRLGSFRVSAKDSSGEVSSKSVSEVVIGDSLSFYDCETGGSFYSEVTNITCCDNGMYEISASSSRTYKLVP